MAIPASTVPVAKLWLFNQITAALVADPAVLVSYDEPGPNLPDDVITVGRVDRMVTIGGMVGSGGAGWLDEEYTIEVAVYSYRGGDDARGVFERACDLVDAVVAVVRADPSLGGAVVVARPALIPYEPDWEDDHKGRLVDALVGVVCRARI